MTSADTTTLQEAASLSSHERGLVVVSTLRANGTIQSSLVNAGVLAHPATGETILALVAVGPVKLANLRARPQVTATFRNGWQWAAVEGLAGPDDPHPQLEDFLRATGFSCATGPFYGSVVALRRHHGDAHAFKRGGAG